MYAFHRKLDMDTERDSLENSITQLAPHQQLLSLIQTVRVTKRTQLVSKKSFTFSTIFCADLQYVGAGSIPCLVQTVRSRLLRKSPNMHA